MAFEIVIENATVSYRDHIALEDVNLSIGSGNFLAVIGPNGAGKTTLLTLINGLGKIRGGSVKIDGNELTGANATKFRRKIGYVPQNLNIDPRTPISVFESVILGRYGKIGILRHPSRKDREIALNACETVRIGHLLKRPVGQLSGGEAQKASIARALVQEPEILLLDEPTANLDPKARNEIQTIVEKIYTKRKITTLFVTHVLEHLPKVCTHAALIKGGKIINTGRIPEVLSETNLRRLYDFAVAPPDLS